MKISEHNNIQLIQGTARTGAKGRRQAYVTYYKYYNNNIIIIILLILASSAVIFYLGESLRSNATCTLQIRSHSFKTLLNICPLKLVHIHIHIIIQIHVHCPFLSINLNNKLVVLPALLSYTHATLHPSTVSSLLASQLLS